MYILKIFDIIDQVFEDQLIPYVIGRLDFLGDVDKFFLCIGQFFRQLKFGEVLTQFTFSC